MRISDWSSDVCSSDLGGAHQPGNKRRVFHRIPKPPATPAQLVIGPPATQCYAKGKEEPRRRSPRPGPPRPGRIQLAGKKGSNCEGKYHRKPDIAHVQQRGVKNQPAVQIGRASSRGRVGSYG